MRRHCELVVGWNRSYSNLISKNDEPRIVTRHVVESIEPASWLDSFGIADWVDFGSGAGFPAVPLAIAGVGQRWLLVESRRPKVLFLKKLLLETGLDQRVSAIHSRLELLSGQIAPVGGFTSRATTRIEPTLELASHFVSSGGSAFLWKGSSWRGEMREGAPWTSEWTFDRVMELAGGLVVVARFIRM
jgi:16S rRNA (guanine527-N7)-methyltransferase